MANGQIFLGGGGGAKESLHLDREFAKIMIASKKPMLYIPIAINEVKHPYSECHAWILSVFKPLGFENIDMWTELLNKSFLELSKFSGVYVGGGNTFKLLRDFRKSGFDKLLLKFHKAGGHIYGGSAGAIILGKTIATAKHADKNEVELTNLKGLNLAKNFAVWCHYQVKDRHNLEILSKDERISILALEESAGAIVQNDLIIPVGPGTVLQFDGTVSEPLNKAISVK